MKSAAGVALMKNNYHIGGVCYLMTMTTVEIIYMNERVWSNGGMIQTGRKTLNSVGGRWMSMEQWWNDTDRGKLKDWEKYIIQHGW
jgi:hypothetical protein